MDTEFTLLLPLFLSILCVIIAVTITIDIISADILINEIKPSHHRNFYRHISLDKALVGCNGAGKNARTVQAEHNGTRFATLSTGKVTTGSMFLNRSCGLL